MESTRSGVPAADPWPPRTAWAAIELLTGGAAAWLPANQRAQVRRTMLALDVESVVGRLSRRADVRIHRCDPVLSDEIADSFVVVRSGPGAFDGYADEAVLADVMTRHRMDRDPGGNAVVRVLDEEIGQDFVEVIAQQGSVLAGIDLAGSTDRHERALGLRIVSEALRDLS